MKNYIKYVWGNISLWLIIDFMNKRKISNGIITVTIYKKKVKKLIKYIEGILIRCDRDTKEIDSFMCETNNRKLV